MWGWQFGCWLIFVQHFHFPYHWVMIFWCPKEKKTWWGFFPPFFPPVVLGFFIGVFFPLFSIFFPLLFSFFPFFLSLFSFLLLLFIFLPQNLKDVRFRQRKRWNALDLPEKSTFYTVCLCNRQSDSWIAFRSSFNIQPYQHSAWFSVCFLWKVAFCWIHSLLSWLRDFLRSKEQAVKQMLSSLCTFSSLSRLPTGFYSQAKLRKAPLLCGQRKQGYIAC